MQYQDRMPTTMLTQVTDYDILHTREKPDCMQDQDGSSITVLTQITDILNTREKCNCMLYSDRMYHITAEWSNVKYLSILIANENQ